MRLLAFILTFTLFPVFNISNVLEFKLNKDIIELDDRITIEELEEETIKVTNRIFTINENYIEKYEGVEGAVGLAYFNNNYESFTMIVEVYDDLLFDLDTYYHELAHCIDFYFNISNEFTKTLIHESYKLFKEENGLEHALSDNMEYFASWYASFRMYPNQTKLQSQATYKYLNEYINLDKYLLEYNLKNIIEYNVYL
ncbi:MAG: hypothetical protein ACRC28_18420 [Clostridium sp.]|uniref:hypothetical protein n=1 Tax=Clostridium sp. TaxID=1506 RepID=UPI003F330B75